MKFETASILYMKTHYFLVNLKEKLLIAYFLNDEIQKHFCRSQVNYIEIVLSYSSIISTFSLDPLSFTSSDPLTLSTPFVGLSHMCNSLRQILINPSKARRLYFLFLLGVRGWYASLRSLCKMKIHF